MAEKVGDAYVDLGTRDVNFNRGMARAEKRTLGFQKHGLVAVAAITAVGAALGKLIKISNAQEDAERDIGAALRAHGDEAEKLLPVLKKQASAIQDLTRYGDEQNLQTMATLRNLGVQADALGVATKQSIGLAKALGLDANAAAKYTALARQGEFTILQRYVPALRSATSEAEKQAIVTDLMNKGWKQAQESSQTTSGQIDQLSNAFGDLGETIGDLLSGDGLGGVFADMRIAIEDIDEALTQLGENDGIAKLSGAFGKFTDALRVAAGFTGAITAGSNINEAADIAFAELEKAAKKRASRKKQILDEISGDLVGNREAASSLTNGRGKQAMSFTSFESAIRNIQTSLGKDDSEKEQKKQTSILGNIDKGISAVNESIGKMSVVGA